jgi:hypothetical protein
MLMPGVPLNPPAQTSGKWSVYIGLVVAIFGYLNQAQVIAVLPHWLAPYVVIVGAIATGLGNKFHTDQTNAAN